VFEISLTLLLKVVEILNQCKWTMWLHLSRRAWSWKWSRWKKRI